MSNIPDISLTENSSVNSDDISTDMVVSMVGSRTVCIDESPGSPMAIGSGGSF